MSSKRVKVHYRRLIRAEETFPKASLRDRIGVNPWSETGK